MELKVTRRRFGQLAIASTTVAGLSYLASRTVAQTPTNLAIVGVSRGNVTSNDKASTTNVDSISAADTQATTDAAPNQVQSSISNGIVMQFLDLGTGQVQDLSPPQSLSAAPANQNGSTANITSDERFTGLTYLADNTTLVAAVTPDSTSRIGNQPTRLLFMGASPRSQPVSGLQPQEAIESLLLLKDGSLIGLVVGKDGSPPARIADINPQNGQVSFTQRVSLPADLRFSTLAQCPDGKLYTSVYQRNGDTELWQLDLGQKTATFVAKLTIDGRQWNNGLQSLVCNSASQLLALGALRYKTTSSLYSVDVNTGAMTQLRNFNVAEIAIRPS